MKCICRSKAQALVGEKIVTFDAGSVAEFDECPCNFEPLEGAEVADIDFDTAEKEELLEAEYDLQSLKDFIEEKFDKKAGNKGKVKTVDLLLDCRYRAVDLNSVL